MGSGFDDQYSDVPGGIKIDISIAIAQRKNVPANVGLLPTNLINGMTTK